MKVPSPSAERGFVLMMVVVTLFLLTAVALWLGRDNSVAMHTVLASKQRASAQYAAEAGLKHAQWLVNASSCANYPSLPVTDLNASGDVSYSAAIAPASGSPVTVTTVGKRTDGSAVTLSRTMPVYQAPTTITYTAIADTYLQGFWPNDTAGFYNFAYFNAGSKPETPLVQFDLTGIGNTSAIESAVLRLAVNPVSNKITAHALERSWTETGASWNNAESGTPWSSPGGDIDSAIAAVSTVDPNYAGYVFLDVTEQVQEWVTTGENFGLAFKTTDQSSFNLSTKEQPNPDNAPQLTVAVRCECGVSCEITDTSCNSHFENVSLEHQESLEAVGDGQMDSIGGVTFFPPDTNIKGIVSPETGMLGVVDGKGKRLTLLTADGIYIAQYALSGLADPRGITWVAGGQYDGHIAVIHEKGKTLALYDSSLNLVTTMALTIVAEGITHIGTTESGNFENDWAIIGKDGNETVLAVISQGAVVRHSVKLVGSTVDAIGIVHIPNSDKLVVATLQNQGITIDFSASKYSQYTIPTPASSVISGVSINTATCEHVAVDDVDELAFVLAPAPPANCPLEYQDDFDSGNYSGSTGPTHWAQPWVESGESDGPSWGNIRIRGAQNKELRLSGSNKGIAREVDLSGATGAILSFEYRRSGMDSPSEYARLIINSGAGWVTLAQYGGPGTDAANIIERLDISEYLSPSTQIGFLTGGLNSTDFMYVDNVQIFGCIP